MKKGDKVMVINSELIICGQSGVVSKVRKGYYYKYIVLIKGRKYKLFKNDIAKLKGSCLMTRNTVAPSGVSTTAAGVDGIYHGVPGEPALPCFEVANE